MVAWLGKNVQDVPCRASDESLSLVCSVLASPLSSARLEYQKEYQTSANGKPKKNNNPETG